MCCSWKLPELVRKGAPRRVLLWCAATFVFTPIWASAQVPITQDGRLFDANTQISGSRYNFGRPQSPLLLGNSVATGNVRSGLSFRGFQPISDPTSFMTTIPSGALSNFRRDSVSVADAALASPLIGGPWYAPSLTAPTVGFLSGQFLPRTPIPDQRLQPARDSGIMTALRQPLGPIGPPPSAVRGSSELLSAQIIGMIPGELTSSIFGPPQPPAATPTRETFTPSVVEPGLRGGQATIGQTGINWTAPYLQEVPGSRPPLGTMLDLVRERRLQRFPVDTEQEPGTPGELLPQPQPQPQLPSSLGPVMPEPEQSDASPLTFGPGALAERFGESRTLRPGAMDSAGADLAGISAPLPDTSVLPGYDVFTDMQLAMALSGNPNADWFAQMQRAIRENPATAVMLRERADVDAQEFIQQMLNSPIQTFHGRGESPKNNEMLRAESLMEIGHYFEASRRYQIAHRIDPLDPLPLIGRGNALLAAGEYLTAALALMQGFERYPELSRFALDLPKLVGGREIIDIRRADIMRMLETRDDPQLRFLLGYLEYFSGDAKLRESGLANFDRAAHLDTSNSLISRMPALLRHEGTLPPPKLPEQDSFLPEEIPTPTELGAPDQTSPPPPVPLDPPQPRPLETGEPQ
jgi:hypothetical protein